jgi:NADPH:quinone reductase-like Zn-dependent oxidoreductase
LSTNILTSILGARLILEAGLASGALKPVIDRTFKFDEMVEVHRHLKSNGQFGKIVVTV